MSIWLIGVVVLVLLLLVAIVARVRALRHPEPFPAARASILESPLRRIFFSREQTLARSGLAPGLRVLEVGPGGGYLTEAALPRLEPAGRLVCLDLQIEMLRKVRDRLGGSAPPVVCASGSELPFRAGVFDLVFLVAVLGEIPDKAGALREYRRVLRPGGRLAVTEALPDPDYIRTPVLRRLAAAAGFETGARLGSWVQYTQLLGR